jgi:hypothetical protein
MLDRTDVWLFTALTEDPQNELIHLKDGSIR